MKGSTLRRSPFSRLSMRTRRSISGYLFIMPFIIGFLAFMVSPLLMSLQMTFSQVDSSTIKPSNFQMISYLGYDKNVTISKQIELPEGLRYNEAQLRNSVFLVEPVSEIVTLDESFSFGPAVELSREIPLPEGLQYDTQASSHFTVVPVEGEAVPTSFAAYLLDNGHVDLFYETVGALREITFPGELPMDITYDAETFKSSGTMNVTLANPVVPASFAGHIIAKGGIGMFISTLPDLLGLENYVHVLTVDPKFNQLLIEEISKMAIHTVAILVVSFVIAILLNQEFKGRAFVRAIFFLPVILSSGVLVNLEADNTLMQGMQELISEQTPFTVTDSMMEILRLTGLGGDLLDIVFDLIAEVYDIVMASGIQIVVFLSGLQNVPASLYEAADVEGCTKWEAFWMITFPLVSPLLIVNIIYTIVDFFTKMSGDLSDLLDDKLLILQYDHMSTMSWIYFLVTLAMIGVSAFIVSKVVATDE